MLDGQFDVLLAMLLFSAIFAPVRTAGTDLRPGLVASFRAPFLRPLLTTAPPSVDSGHRLGKRLLGIDVIWEGGRGAGLVA